MGKISKADNQRITIAYNLDADVAKLKTLHDAGVTLTDEHLSILEEMQNFSSWLLANSIGAVTEQPEHVETRKEGDGDDVKEGPVQ